MILCRVSDPANEDVVAISERIANDNISAAVRFLHALRDDFELLSRFRNAGQLIHRAPRGLKGIRTLPVRKHRNYLILFIPHSDSVEILRIIHGARNLRKVLREIELK